MSLQIGQQVKAEIQKANLTVKQKLGEGGQGIVYLVEGSHGSQAVKWYNAEQSTPEQMQAIKDLVQSGPPRGRAGLRFIWPLDIVTAAGTAHFGYLMPLIDTNQYAELGEIWARRKQAPGFRALCEASRQAANSYRALHLDGYCYRDISAGNLMFDPLTGEALICDNDNVGIDCQSKCQVWGTLEYMAPELIRGEADPSTVTDLHSLAVLLFYLWIWHHPMHGLLEYQFRSWDLPAKRHVYGKNPVFIFDPTDRSNELPSDPDYSTAQKRWDMCPSGLKVLFTQAFTEGTKHRAARVTEGEWQGLFTQLKDGIVACPNDGAENIWEPGQSGLSCWHCRKSIQLPPKLVFTHAGGRHYLLLTKDATIFEWHTNPTGVERNSLDLVGQVVQNPDNPQVWGIRNVSQTPWSATYPDGSTKEVPPQKAVPFNTGVKINIKGTSAEIAL